MDSVSAAEHDEESAAAAAASRGGGGGGGGVHTDVVDYNDDEDTVTGNWSLDGKEGTAAPVETNATAAPPVARVRADLQRLPSSGGLSARDLEVFARLDREYDRALEERDVSYLARYQSVRQSAAFSVAFMFIFLTLATIFFLRQSDWNVAEALLFIVYSITTVGFGHLGHPETPAFQLYTIFFIFIGIATLTIMVAQVYQWLALEASRAQYERDNQYLRRQKGRSHNHPQQRHPNAAAPPTTHAADPAGAGSVDGADHHHHHHSGPVTIGEIQWRVTWMDRAMVLWEMVNRYLRENEYGRAISVVIPFAGLILFGTLVMAPLEGWTLTEALYFSVVSMTTVGFGDLVPTNSVAIIFCILWLPFSIGFMSFFLSNVATFYIRLSDRNVQRLERQLRRRIRLVKEQAARNRREARKRALRGQPGGSRGVSAVDEVFDDDLLGNPHDDDGSDPPFAPEEQTTVRSGGFNPVPVQDALSPAGRKTTVGLGAGGGGGSRRLFGTVGSASKRRERILKNSNMMTAAPPATASRTGAGRSASFDEDENRATTTMSTMRDVLRAVHVSVNQSGAAPSYYLATGLHTATGPPVASDPFFSIRSSSTMQDAFRVNTTQRKPSFALRALVQERFAQIIAMEIAGFESDIEIREDTLSITIETLKDTADKWIIPRRARKAFRAVTFEALYFVGEHGLITRGADALFDLTPFEFHGLFSPLLAALGDAETMESWLTGTRVLAEVDLLYPQQQQQQQGDGAGEDSRASGDGAGPRLNEDTSSAQRPAHVFV